MTPIVIRLYFHHEIPAKKTIRPVCIKGPTTNTIHKREEHKTDRLLSFVPQSEKNTLLLILVLSHHLSWKKMMKDLFWKALIMLNIQAIAYAYPLQLTPANASSTSQVVRNSTGKRMFPYFYVSLFSLNISTSLDILGNQVAQKLSSLKSHL